MAEIASNNDYLEGGGSKITPEYIHSQYVDGETLYGKAAFCFPRRSIIGGRFADGTIAGSRGLNTRTRTGYPGYDCSNEITGRD